MQITSNLYKNMQKILYMELYTNTSTPVNCKTQFLNKQLLFLNYMIYFLITIPVLSNSNELVIHLITKPADKGAVPILFSQKATIKNSKKKSPADKSLPGTYNIFYITERTATPMPRSPWQWPVPHWWESPLPWCGNQAY